MQKIIFFLSLSVICFLSNAQTTSDTSLVPYRSGTKWGFADKTKKIIIQPEYDKVSFFNRGYAIAKKDDKYVLIDLNGNIKTKEEYDDIKNSYGCPEFVGKYLVVEKNKHFFLLDTQTFLLKPDFKYDYIYTINEHFANVRLNDKMGMVDLSGNVLLPFTYQFFDKKNHDLYYIQKSYKDYVGAYGVIDSLGNEIVKPVYQELYINKDGFICAKKNNKYYLFDQHGNKIFGPADDIGDMAYEEEADFYEGKISFRNNSYEGFINMKGEIVIAAEYSFCGEYHNGLAYVRKNDKIGFIDHAGTMIIPMEYEWSTDNFQNGYVELIKNKIIYVFDSTGKSTLPPWFYEERGMNCVDPKSSLIALNNGTHTGLYTKSGRQILPLNYDKIWCIKENRIPVYLNDKMGFADTTGKIIIDLIYDGDFYTRFSEGVCGVKKDGKVGFIDTLGNMVIPFMFDDDFRLYHHRSDPHDYFEFKNGVSLIYEANAPNNRNAFIGAIDTKGNIIIPTIYTTITMKENGLYACYDKNNIITYYNKYGVQFSDE